VLSNYTGKGYVFHPVLRVIWQEASGGVAYYGSGFNRGHTYFYCLQLSGQPYQWFHLEMEKASTELVNFLTE